MNVLRVVFINNRGFVRKYRLKTTLAKKCTSRNHEPEKNSVATLAGKKKGRNRIYIPTVLTACGVRRVFVNH